MHIAHSPTHPSAVHEPHPSKLAMAGVRCLQRKLDKLARSIHPVTVSTALLAEEIIEQRAWEEARREGLPHYDRSLNLLETVMRCVGTRPSVYEQFCKILEQETVTEGLAAELRGKMLADRCLI